MDRKTPLYDVHVRYGGKIVSFGGYLLPVQYSGVIQEHMAVRTKAGLFDVSHMGEITCRGEGSLAFLNHVLTNDYSSLVPGGARYSPMCNEHGGTVDDLIVYMKAENDYLIVVNAANREKDYRWMLDHNVPGCTLEDVSDSYAQLAIQGPEAKAVMLEILPEDKLPVKNYTALFGVDIDRIDTIVSKTGYTGERGYELYFPAEHSEKMWELLMSAGKDHGLIPCGLGARDTLRLEAAMPLYGHELTEDITPLESDLGRFVKLDKAEFVGKEALEASEPKRGRIGLRVVGRGIPRENMDVYADGKLIGRTTSGTFCPFINRPAAMAILEKEYCEPGKPVEVDIRGRRVQCETEALPFYKRPKLQKKS
ncbi:MAG: glycine cleavage system aminomethyltransferase GcvT [Oscillospiraceae bacterium]